jgi:hypothetical protein
MARTPTRARTPEIAVGKKDIGHMVHLFTTAFTTLLLVEKTRPVGKEIGRDKSTAPRASDPHIACRMSRIHRHLSHYGLEILHAQLTFGCGCTAPLELPADNLCGRLSPMGSSTCIWNPRSAWAAHLQSGAPSYFAVHTIAVETAAGKQLFGPLECTAAGAPRIQSQISQPHKRHSDPKVILVANRRSPWPPFAQSSSEASPDLRSPGQ